ncbi:MAG: hypothetical protein ISS71_02195 [Phycisphaerae bacterium]|nr:hypothetical protein [Phycisphaerae bacterium]
MKPLIMTASLFVMLFILVGCRAPQKEVAGQSLNEGQEWKAEEAETRWYLKPEYRHTGSITLSEYEKWVIKCLKDYEFIKPGVTRAEIMRKFPMDGGLQTISPVRFVHPECSFFKVDVSFTFERDYTDQGRAIMGKNDKVVEVSKPYIENPFYD